MRTRACFFVALRYLLGRAREGGRYLRGATAGIAISLVPIIVTLIVADGMIQGILGRFLELSSGHMQVFVPSGRSPEDAAEKIREVRGVTGAWPELRGMAVLVGPGGRAGTSVRAVDPEFWREEGSLRYLQLVSGSLEFEGNRDMLLGRSLAAAIGAEPGDTVRMMTINTASGETAVPRVTAFTLRGIVSSGYHELDALWCVIGEEGGRGLVGLDRNSSSILVKVADPYRERELDGMFWKLRDALGDGFRIHGWQELLGGQYDSYRSTRQMLLFIMAL
ncbi:MAG: ABC transporter permease, partial [Treponema sp.]|nr:ABC transporter permease [Treponema sp.]